MLDENKKCGETETRIDGEVSWEQDTLHFSKRVPWQCEVQGQTYNIPKKEFRNFQLLSRLSVSCVMITRYKCHPNLGTKMHHERS